MPGIIVDGSNVARHNAKSGKLASLENLALTINCLVQHGYEPFTVFDASFRYRLRESSDGRKLFEYLTKEVSDHFQMAPRGEDADLFILELAISTGFPVVSNDTYGDYGKLRGNILSYAGGVIELNNFKMMAGVMVIPDRGIRYLVRPEDRSLSIKSDDEITRLLARKKAIGSDEEPRDDPGAQHPLAADGQTPLDGTSRTAVFRIISRYLKAGGALSLGELGTRLREHRLRYDSATAAKKPGRGWFGYPSLKSFIETAVPGVTVEGDRIMSEDRAPGDDPQ